MTTKQKLHQIHLNEWVDRFNDQKSSGLTVQEWCDQNNFTIHTYNYWKHILKEEVATQVLPEIVPISLPSPLPTQESLVQADSHLTNCAIRAIRSTAKLTLGDFSIEGDSTVSEDFLCKLIKAVRYA